MTEVSSSKALAFANRFTWSFFPRPLCSEVVYIDSPMVRLLILVHLHPLHYLRQSYLLV